MPIDEVEELIKNYIKQVKDNIPEHVYAAKDVNPYWIDLATQQWNEQQADNNRQKYNH